MSLFEKSPKANSSTFSNPQYRCKKASSASLRIPAQNHQKNTLNLNMKTIKLKVATYNSTLPFLRCKDFQNTNAMQRQTGEVGICLHRGILHSIFARSDRLSVSIRCPVGIIQGQAVGAALLSTGIVRQRIRQVQRNSGTRIGNNVGFYSEYFVKHLVGHDLGGGSDVDRFSAFNGDHMMGVAGCMIQVVYDHDDRPLLFLIELSRVVLRN